MQTVKGQGMHRGAVQCVKSSRSYMSLTASAPRQVAFVHRQRQKRSHIKYFVGHTETRHHDKIKREGRGVKCYCQAVVYCQTHSTVCHTRCSATHAHRSMTQYRTTHNIHKDIYPQRLPLLGHSMTQSCASGRCPVVFFPSQNDATRAFLLIGIILTLRQHECTPATKTRLWGKIATKIPSLGVRSQKG